MLLSSRWIGSIIVFSIMLAMSVRAQDVARLSLSRQLVADADDGVLDQFDLASACLIASGVNDQRELADLQTRIAALASPKDAVSALRSPVERAEVILRRLHEHVLTGEYDKHATDLRRTLAEGDYNCLSALVLYVELCRQADVPLEICSQPGHAYCLLPNRSPHAPREAIVTRSVTPTVGIHVEPASPAWPDGEQSQPPASPSRSITPVQLVGKFYYNRGIELLEQQQFAAGIQSLSTACRLDPLDADARTNLLAGLNNWALALVEQDQPAAAAVLIARGLAVDPHFPPLVANERYLRARIAAPRKTDF